MHNFIIVIILGIDAWVVMAKQFWAIEPADINNIQMTAYPIGNGHQAAMPVGIPGNDLVAFNHDSLWSGGPFANTSYIGGNPPNPVYQYLPGIQESIFANGTGDESALYGTSTDYGSYEALGNLTVSIAGIENYTAYRRSLDLGTAIHQTTYVANGVNFTTTQLCSYPDQLCIYQISSSQALPDVTVGLIDTVRTTPASNSTCSSNGVHLHGQTQADDGMGLIGMIFDAQVQLLGSIAAQISCNTNNQLVISGGNVSSLTLLYTSGTDYDQTKGNSANNYSFKGSDPYQGVMSTLEAAATKSWNSMLQNHVADHQSWFNLFILDLPDPKGSANVDTTTLMNGYTTEDGDPFVEALILDYARYLFIASSRDGSLPPNLQGKWAPTVDPAWSSDYHIDVNLQMNHWHTEAMGLGDLMGPLWAYMADTWVPRGSETAQLLYNASGWVAFSNVNTFGHTGQENDAVWSDYPASGAWMMKHAWDRYDYSRNQSWYQSTGYPLIKEIAQFWLSMLQSDQYFKDGTLVAVPCNSPEHGPTTFGCTHYQQLIWELLDQIIQNWNVSGDTDQTFLNSVREASQSLDSGVHVGSWGQIQEWKLDIDTKNDTHRHLSNLYGFYPGYSISSIHGKNTTITDAVATTLYSRGNGTEDSNTGWEKVWRAACWAALNNTDEAYTEFKYSIDMNFAQNGLSVYTSGSWPYELAPPFQIDANFGIAGAGIAMLATDLPQAAGDTTTHTVVLGPAIPSAWGGGSVQGFRLRGGGSIDFGWDVDGSVTTATLNGRTEPIVVFNKAGDVLAQV